MAWWKLFWNPKGDIGPIIETHRLPVIGEPVISIVNLINKDRHRFLMARTKVGDSTIYEAPDTYTEEVFTIKHHVFPPYGYDIWEGLFWMSSEEAKWAVESIRDSIDNKKRRAYRISAANERNRLIEIYA